ncbi:serine/threonine protein kinase [Serratia microhaemolytica]|uniref:serine/threonine protein kinase n=1 Tax=Serratia microhaemolytica TaxID=2675110 RepID=UPI000FDD73B5|nr:serine/threonine protein kinase [Serratia microhaemolytica]
MNLAAFNFASLSPDLIMDALETVGVRVDSGLTALNSYENRVYQFNDEQRQRYVVKFYRPQRWSREQIIEEHQFTIALSNRHLPVISPLLLQGNSLHSYGDWQFALFASVGGRQYEVDNLQQLEQMGTVLGRLHQLGAEQPFIVRPTIGIEEYLTAPQQVLTACELVPKAERDAFLLATEQLIAAISRRWRLDWRPIRLHGDCHPGNILWRDGPLFVDFDDARNGPAVQDLWMLLHGEQHEQRMQLDILLEGYSEFASFDPAELALIEPLRAMRMVHYLAWVARRWQDPAFPRSFPWMVESDFWLSQTAAFTESVLRLQEPPLQLTPMY